MRIVLILAALLIVHSAAWADQVTVSGGTIYVTRDDCAMLQQHQPSPDVTFRPGVDVNGKYVAPADLPGTDYSNLLPDTIKFDVLANPLTYGGGAGNQALNQVPGRFLNTAMPVAHVAVDLKTGDVTLNGQPLSGVQTKTLRDACRKAGFH